MLTDPHLTIDDEGDARFEHIPPGDPPDDVKERNVTAIERRRSWSNKESGPRNGRRRFGRRSLMAVAAASIALAITSSHAQHVGQALPDPGYMRVSDAILLISPDGRTASAYSKQTGTWRRQAIADAKDKKISPIASSTVICFQAGDWVYAFSGPKGIWDSVKLPKGAEETVVPALTFKVACFQAGDRLYAFGAPTGKWQYVDLPAGSKVDREVHSDMVIALAADRLYAFSATAGRWDSEDIELKRK